MTERKKQASVFPWVNHAKSSTFIQSILVGLVFLVGGYIIFYGDDRWFSKVKGEAMEKKQVTIELDSKHRDELIIREQHHLHEKLDDMRIEQKEGITELKNVVIDYLRSTR